MKENKGITLISLAIIIVVMMILAGVVINLSERNEEAIEVANLMKEDAERASIEEEIKTALTENPPATYQELINFLSTYGTVENKDDYDNATLVTSNGGYSIKVKDIWNIDATSAGVEIGDYIKYNAQNKSYLVSSEYSGTNSDVTLSIPSSSNIIWRVFDINEQTGEIKVVPTNLSNFSLSVEGVEGYNNIVKLLNDICDTIFTDEGKNVKARSINIEDIEAIASNTDVLRGNNYNSEQEYPSASYPAIESSKNDINEQDKFYTGTKTGKVTLRQTYYTGTILFENEIQITILTPNRYWLASRAVRNTTGKFFLRTINSTNTISIEALEVYDTAGNEINGTKDNEILPVLILNKNTIITDGDGSQEKPFSIK